jgi:hypothetical protein
MTRIAFAWLMLGFVECYSQEASNLPLTIRIKVEREYILTKSKSYYQNAIWEQGLVINSDSVKQKYYDISISIKNTSNKPIGIWLMTCSWEENFIVSNNYIFIGGHECDSNYPSRVKLKSEESKIYHGRLLKSIKFDYPGSNFFGQQAETTKLGLIIVGDIFKNDKLDYDMEMEDKSKWKIVWSNPLFLFGKHPEPKFLK